MFLLDTDVLSASRRQDKADPKFVAWIANTDPYRMYISCISLLEIQIGVLRLSRRDRRQAGDLERWLHNLVVPRFEGRILPFGVSTALRCAELHVPNPRPERDAMIAATGLENDLIIVSRNARHFRPMGVRLVNPWEDANAQ